MPSHPHEALIELFRHRPSLAAELLGGVLGLDLPAHDSARVAPAEYVDLHPTEYRADAVVVLSDGTGPVLAVVVEVQLRRDARKRWTWPVYVTTLRARLECPVALLVVCPDDSTARWCAAPIDLGPSGAALTPFVLGPDRVPVITDHACEDPELIVLSAMAHGGDPRRRAVLDALVEALANVDQRHAALYADTVFAALPQAAKDYLEGLMAAGLYEYQSDFVRRNVLQGRAEAGSRSLLAVLDARGIVVPDDAKARISNCTDYGQFEIWIRRAATAESFDDVFA